MAGNEEEIIGGTPIGGTEGDSQSSIVPDDNTEGDDTLTEQGNDNSSNENDGDDNDSSSQNGSESEDWVPDLIVDEKDPKNKTFQARVYHEQNNDVYGAEIVLFDDKEVIDTILITDNLKLEKYNAVIENMEKAYVPFTKEDVENIEIYKRIASGEITEDDEEYEITWSKLHDKGDLKTILTNNYEISASEQEELDKDDFTLINATHLNGLNSGNFAPAIHTHSNFLTIEHDIPASTTKRGHVILVDNLDESSVGDGKALSARQGKLLNDELTDLQNKFNNSWSKEQSFNEFISYKTNDIYRLIVCTYHRKNFTGFNNKSGNQLLHGKDTILPMYQPSNNIVTPLTVNGINLYYTANGEVYINSLSRVDSVDIDVQVMWHY